MIHYLFLSVNRRFGHFRTSKDRYLQILHHLAMSYCRFGHFRNSNDRYLQIVHHLAMFYCRFGHFRTSKDRYLPIVGTSFGNVLLYNVANNFISQSVRVLLCLLSSESYERGYLLRGPMSLFMGMYRILPCV